jgi:SAM-dependent methyltransferase
MVLDVGGRIQPYRPLLAGRLKMYVAVDPQATGLLDVIAAGEQLPFAGGCFDLVICTQTLGYASDPFGVIGEIRRVLKHGGVLLLSVPALFPCHHDERWRFLPDGLRVLLADFSHVEVEPEGHSFAGVMRTINVCLNIFIKRRIFRRVASGAVMPLINLAGIMLDRLSRGNDQFTTNYSALAIK